jgi:flagellar hook assembly protein FlgD
MQNYPNPFNPETKIEYSLQHSGNVNIKIYDVLGREVIDLLNQEKSAGTHSIFFNGAKLSSGIYYYRIKSGNFFETKKMLLIK